MVDYRELCGVSGLSRETNNGESVKVAVLDTGIPRLEDILVSLSDNMTGSSDKDNSHATFIGSLLFGHTPVTGVCNQATACFIKVFNGLFATPDIVAQAIRKAVDSWKVDVINLSLGFSSAASCPESLRKACQYAYQKNVVIVSASGNDGGSSLWPAALQEVISVGATDGTDCESFSNRGKVDFVVAGKDLEGYDTEGKTIKRTGTSFSAALVSGLFALLIARRRKNGKSFTVDLLKQELVDTCLDLKTEGYDEETGYGIPFAVYRPKVRRFQLWLKIKSIYAKIVKLVKQKMRLIRRTNNHDE